MILDSIPFKPDFAQLTKTLRIRPDSDHVDDLRAMVEAAQAVAQPKAIYKLSFIDDRRDGQVVIDGIAFDSHVLRVNLDGVNRVFPYVATCGTEIAAWAATFTDLLDQYWADAIMEQALRDAIRYLNAHVMQTYRVEHIAEMNPGSLEDWPLSQQAPLFDLLGNPLESVGVELTESFLMRPAKSVSGLYFQTETSFVNCQLCPRVDCPSRRAPYDPAAYEAYFPADAGDATCS